MRGRLRRNVALSVDPHPSTHLRPTSGARLPLGLLLAFGALNAAGGGIYGVMGAQGIPVEWLAGSPFTDYFIPSLILLLVVGGSMGAASIAVLARFRFARLAALGAGIIVLGWIGVQVAIIGYVSWMQPATALGGLAILGGAWRLPDASAVPWGAGHGSARVTP